MVKNEVKRTSINLLQQTKENLDSIRHIGQSYGGLIQELIGLWKKEHGAEGTDRASSAERGEGD